MEDGITISWGVLFAVTLIAVFVLAVAISAAMRVGGGLQTEQMTFTPPVSGTITQIQLYTVGPYTGALVINDGPNGSC